MLLTQSNLRGAGPPHAKLWPHLAVSSAAKRHAGLEKAVLLPLHACSREERPAWGRHSWESRFLSHRPALWP